MIFISKIVGESFDLQTGKDLPSSVVLSNGKREITLSLGPEDIRRIVELYVEASGSPVAIVPTVPENTGTPVPPVMMAEVPARSDYVDPDSGTESV